MKTIESKRLQILKLLVAAGADTEKKITALTIDDIVMLDKIRTEDIKLIRMLQKEIKNRNVIGFLAMGTDKEEHSGDDERDGKHDTSRKESIGGDENGGSGSDHGYSGTDAGSSSETY